MRLMSFGVLLGAGVLLAGCQYATTPDPALSVYDKAQFAKVPKEPIYLPFHRYLVDDPTGKPPGTIVVDTHEHFLYYVLPNHKAMRYGVATGGKKYAWTGTATVEDKKEWPTWTPTASEYKRWSYLKAAIPGGTMPGGGDNPLGARAMYLYMNGKDTGYRIHGTNEPGDIGRSVSSGCIRMSNIDAVDLYNRVKIGTKVIVE
ncbi:MAG: L,D-transpeptidase [Hyphomicrobiales bacterium]|nr:L,D-transpeptidase [Hyphomicrobiales bacterium]